MGAKADDKEKTEDAGSERPTDTADLEPNDVADPLLGSSIDEAAEFTGSRLRQIRETRGVSLKSVSEATKVGVQSLRALEEERFEDLPNVRVYVRGFVRCLAQELGLDPENVSKSFLGRWDAWDLEQKELRRH